MLSGENILNSSDPAHRPLKENANISLLAPGLPFPLSGKTGTSEWEVDS